MSRAGREPAEDVKRRIASACKAAGLEVATARMYLRKHQADRVILVAASPPDWSCARPMLMVLTTVGTNGDSSGMVDIRCSTSEDDSVVNFWDNPIMRGRNAVAMADLVRELLETVEEREQVVAAMRLGIEGPYAFEHTLWKKPSDLLRT